MCQFVLYEKKCSLNLGVGIDVNKVAAIEVEEIEDVGIVCFCNVIHQFAVIQHFPILSLTPQCESQQSWTISLLLYIHH